MPESPKKNRVSLSRLFVVKFNESEDSSQTGYESTTK